MHFELFINTMQCSYKRIKTVFLVVIATLNALGSGPSLISNSKRTKAYAIIQMQGGCSEFPRSRGP